MSTMISTAYQRRFSDRTLTSRSHKSLEIKNFYGNRSTFAGKAHYIKDKDSVLIDQT